MKKIFINLLAAFGLILFVSSCENTELNLLDNPNEVTPDKAELGLVYNNVMYNFGLFCDEVSDETMPYVRMTAMDGGNLYQNQDIPNSFNFLWRLAYSELLPDIDLVISLGTASEATNYTGPAKVMKAYIMMSLVDLFGDVPYSEAGKGAEIQNPTPDSGKDVYAAALALLEEAKTDLASPKGNISFDLVYGGNAAKWLKAANSLIIRYHVTTKLAGGSGQAISSIISSPSNYITSSEDDFQFNYGNSRANPDSRHPYYSDGYENGGPSWYMSNYFMWNLFGDKQNEDPRLRYYFYRQDCDETDEDQFTLSCPTIPYPFHWDAGYPFCTASSEYGDPNDKYHGYWGRDHGDNSGIPPDDLKRTAWGLYPAGGKFDADNCAQVSNGGTDGSLGVGIHPILLASFVDFYLAEAALTMGVSLDARATLESGVRKSISKVMAFKGGATDKSFEPTAEQVDAYVNEVLARYDAAGNDSEKLDVVMREFWIASFGNGLEAYNAYRRTGFPSRMQPTLERDPGSYARSFWYPADFVNLNKNISVNKAITDQVFWDTNPADFIK